MAHHDLKLSAEFFDASEAGLKPFEVRFNDRDYQAGDTLQMREIAADGLTLTGRIGRVWKITYALWGSDRSGLRPGWVVLGLRDVAP